MSLTKSEVKLWCHDWSVVLWEMAKSDDSIYLNIHLAKLSKELDEMKGATARQPINTPTVYRGKRVTSHKASVKHGPKRGSLRGKIYDLIKWSVLEGMTDSEIEKSLGGKHQTISSARYSLAKDNWIVDSGKTRRNESGNDCIVWIAQREIEFNR